MDQDLAIPAAANAHDAPLQASASESAATEVVATKGFEMPALGKQEEENAIAKKSHDEIKEEEEEETNSTTLSTSVIPPIPEALASSADISVIASTAAEVDVANESGVEKQQDEEGTLLKPLSKL
jgi:hypothetical protein